MLPRLALALIALSILPVTHNHAYAQDVIVGTGATFPAKVYEQWAEAYTRDTGKPLAYKPAGSSAGVKSITAAEVDFGASDVPLKQAELDKRSLFQFPTLVGGVVPFVNLPGVPKGALHLDAPTLARIYTGAIARWNDPAVRTLNPALDLPSLPVVRAVRADGSGTTEVFVSYLREAAAAEAALIEPKGGVANWPGQPMSADGSSKLVALVKATPGAIGYVSSDYVLRDNLSGVQLRNRRGEWTEPSLAAFKAAIVAGELFKNSLEATPLINIDGPGVWPIVTATYILVPKRPQSAERAARTLNFFYRSFLLGDRAVAGTGFAPLPISTQARIVGLLSRFRTSDGKPVMVIGQADLAAPAVVSASRT